jgi:putative ABC transport system permease protein
MNTLVQDLRYGARILLKHRGVTLVAILATAVGIAANTTIFSTVHSLILRPFNFANQDRLIVVWEQNLTVGNVRGSVAPGNFTDWREQNRTCSQLVAIEQHYFDLTDGDQPERFAGCRVTEGFFDTLGVKATLGRTFLPEENEPGRERVVVLKNTFWQQRFAADPEIVGKTLTLNQKSFTVIGVMPPDFNYPYHSGEMWTPLVFDRQMRIDRGAHYLEAIGMLEPHTGVKEAQEDLSAIAGLAEQQFPETNSGRNAYVVSLTDDAVRGAWTAMPTLIGAAIFVLLIACANVANLLLARSASRQKEIAVRLALGASRWRLIRQLLTESVLLAVFGGGLGLLMSIWAIDGLSRGIPDDFAKFIPGWDHFGMDRTVFAFTLVATVVTGMLFGLAPAWQASRTNFNEALKDGGKGVPGTGTRNALRSALVVSEVALSLVLLIGAGLLTRSFAAMMRADLGIRPENVLAMQVSLPREGYKEESKRRLFFAQLLGRVESLPDVSGAGAVNLVPVSGMGDNSLTFQVVGDSPFPKGREPYVQHRIATPGYFNAIGTALRRGRLFTEQDDAQATPVVLINETFARRFLPDREPVGERLKLGNDEKKTLEIVGVVADVKNDDVQEQPDPSVYVPYDQQPWLTMNLIVHTRHEPTVVAGSIRSDVRNTDPNVPVSNVKPLLRMIDERVSSKRVMTWTLGVFAAAALLLAAVGIYAVMSYVVAQRTHEIGIRLALGAQTHDVLALVISQGLKLTLIGVAIGLAGAFAMTRALTYFLFGVTATDPVTFVGLSLLLASIALLACYVPAHKAARVDPMVALRYE